MHLHIPCLMNLSITIKPLVQRFIGSEAKDNTILNSIKDTDILSHITGTHVVKKPKFCSTQAFVECPQLWLGCRPYCHREGYGDPYYRQVGPGAALAETDLYNQRQQQILQSNPASPNASLNAYCNGKSLASTGPPCSLCPQNINLGLSNQRVLRFIALIT